MSNRNDFEDKAARLMHKLNSTSTINHAKTRPENAKLSLQELSRIKEELDFSDIDNRKKMKGLNDALRKLEDSLVEEGQIRAHKGIYWGM